MPLSATQVKRSAPRAKSFKLFDGEGMFLLVHPNGSKYWRLKYRFGDKQKTLALGVFPYVSLAQARERRFEAKKLLADGVDPGAARRAEKAAQAGKESFEAIAREWYAQNVENWSESYSTKLLRRLEVDAFPWIGTRPIDEIDAPELLRLLRRVESRGAVDMAHRIKQYCGQVFRYAIVTGRAGRDPTADLRGALKPTKVKHLASITDPKAIGPLLRAIEGYQGAFVTRCALQLAPLVFVRPGELRRAEWPECDFDALEWRIPPERMKAGAPHVVPLSEQAIEILEDIHPLTGQGRYVFPARGSGDKPMSENTVNGALRRLGYSGAEMTGHGFRSMASTLLNEQGWNRDAIERQLAHAERDNVRAAYNYADYLPERRRMMQAWADYLDSLRRGAEVIPIEAGGRG